ncbi:MAG: FG-GAP-like repeat-containing protein [candidate division KSB1 bacterium]|nr:FG-GAP-like repeat-containing protein [candidate division KSB1 bacterium]
MKRCWLKLLFILINLWSIALHAISFSRALNETPDEFLTSHVVKKARFFSQDLGYTFTNTNSIFKYENGIWQKINLPYDVELTNVFFVQPEMIWVTYQLPSHYREDVLLYHRGKWQQVEIPHVDQLLGMAFADENHGWAVGRWGELLKYENGQWLPMRSPTRCHIRTIVLDSFGRPMITTDCQIFNQVFALQKNGQWRYYAELEAFPVFDLWPSSPDFFYFLTEVTHKLYLYREGDVIQIPIDGIRDFALIPPDSLYLLTDNAVYLVVDTLKQTIRYFSGIAPNRIAASEDGMLWIYGGINGVIPIRGRPEVNLVTRMRLAIQSYFDLGYALGAAFLTISREKQGIYIIDGVLENDLLMIHRDFILWYLESVSVDAFGLQEPTKTMSGRPNYDFSVLTADFNNDGREDVFVTGFYGKVVFFLNLGQGKFKDISSWAGFKENPHQRLGIAATADVDNDGDLDILIPNEYGQPLLMINNGVGRFADEAAQRGLDIPLGSKAGAFADIDGDGWIDLAVTTFGEGTYLYRNRGDGTFDDIRAENPALRSDRPEKCSSLTFVDYDNDGDFDVFISKLYYPNQLLQNDGSGHFRDVTREVGLHEHADSRGATFFDYDLDGDLDVFIANMGLDRFYENDGSQFIPNEEFDRLRHNGWLPRRVTQTLYGGFTTGTVKMDMLRDGDIDLLILSFDHESYLLHNYINKSDYLVLEVTGVKSNRSAIGAVAELYPAGKAGDRTAILATQMIESTSGYASHAQKLLHFGVDAKKKYDVVVKFPGGAVRELRSLSPGRYYRIEELSGFPKFHARLQQFVRNQIFGYRSHLTVLQILLLMLLVIMLILYWIRQNCWLADATGQFILGVLLGFISIKSGLVIRDDVLFFVAPIGAALFAGAAVMQVYKLWRLNYSPAASMEVLSMKLAAFGHSQTAANLLSSLEFQLRNFPKGEMPWEFRYRLLQKVDSIREQVIPDILLIIEYLMTLKIARNQAIRLLRITMSFQRGLRQIHRRLQSSKPIRDSALNNITQKLQALRGGIRKLRDLVLSQEICDIIKETQVVIRAFVDSDTEVVLHSDEQNLYARIPITEFRSILNELIINARHAMRGKAKKRVDIYIQSNGEIILEVVDQGRGIPKKKWETIFERNFSDRESGGFGLYHARFILEKFDGKILIKTSQINRGTTIQMHLQKATPIYSTSKRKYEGF